MMMNRRSAMAMLGLTAACPWAFANQANAAADLRMIIGMDAGGGTDINARLMAKYLARHFAGDISIENDGRAGGVTALQAALGETKLTVSTLETTNILSAAVDDDYPLDIKNVALLDNFVLATRVLAIRSDIGIKSVADWRASGKTLRFGARTPNAYKGIEMKLLSKLWGVNLLIVPGYGNTETKAAFAAGELDLILGSYTSIRPTTEDGGAQILVRISDAAGEDRASTELPTAGEFVVNDSFASLLPVFNSISKLQLAFVTSVNALKDAGPLIAALGATKLDPEYQTAATEAGLVIDKRGSDEIRAEFRELITGLDDIRAQLSKLL